MPNDRRGERALALIAALQTILDELPQGSDATDAPVDEIPAVKDPTHQLFMERLNQDSLAGLFASIRIIHHIHGTEPAAS